MVPWIQSASSTTRYTRKNSHWNVKNAVLTCSLWDVPLVDLEESKHIQTLTKLFHTPPTPLLLAFISQLVGSHYGHVSSVTTRARDLLQVHTHNRDLLFYTHLDILFTPLLSRTRTRTRTHTHTHTHARAHTHTHTHNLSPS